jgi:4-amino-4-deoxy-L-arabinose transferase-like glycosyltransferase
LICLIFVAALTPAVPWVEFSGGMENFNVATAQESQRDGHWLMPYLGLEPRAAKPPLVHWITALGIKYLPNSLAWGARLPSIAVSCAMLLAVYELGRTLEDERLGLIGAFVCGTTILFLKFAWQASYDLHLALWVTVANWQLALATFKGRRWGGSLGAGLALGLALMTKGPVAILQTFVPWAVFLMWRRLRRSPTQSSVPSPQSCLAGLAVTLAIALPWTLYAAWLNRHMLGLIYNEVALGTEASYETRTRWHSYIVFFPMMLPWLIWFLTGFIEAARGRDSRWLLILWLILPIAVMEFFPERRDRYLLPMAGPAALLAAYGVLRHVPAWRKWTNLQKWLVILHGLCIATIAIGLPIYGAWKLTTVDGQPWYTPAFASAVVASATMILLAGILVYRRSRLGFIGGTVLLMLLSNLVFLWGYKDSSSGRSQGRVLAIAILDRYPDALVYNATPDRRKFLPLELLIYLNRDVPAVDDPAKLPTADQPQVLIYSPSADHPDAPPAAPAGFIPLAERKINTGMYYTLVRERP